jgi:hypothetical protein
VFVPAQTVLAATSITAPSAASSGRAVPGTVQATTSVPTPVVSGASGSKATPACVLAITSIPTPTIRVNALDALVIAACIRVWTNIYNPFGYGASSVSSGTTSNAEVGDGQHPDSETGKGQAPNSATSTGRVPRSDISGESIGD